MTRLGQMLVEEGREEGIKEGHEAGMKEGRKAGIKEGRKEGRREGEQKTILESIRSLMETLKLSADQAMEALKVPVEEREKYRTMI